MERRKDYLGIPSIPSPLHRPRTDDFVDMRVTVTLEDDLASQLRELMRQRNASFKKVVNKTLSDGLRALSRPHKNKPPQRLGGGGRKSA